MQEVAHLLPTHIYTTTAAHLLPTNIYLHDEMVPLRTLDLSADHDPYIYQQQKTQDPRATRRDGVLVGQMTRWQAT